MLRLKKVSCVHNVLKGKDGLPLTLSASFVGTANETGCFLDITLSPSPNQEAIWLRLEQLIQRAVRDNMKPHDVEEFYQDDPECTCNAPEPSPLRHSLYCPVYQQAQNLTNSAE